MKKIVLVASLLVGVSLNAQEKVNEKELQRIAAELETKYNQDVEFESNRTGLSTESLIESGFQGIYNGASVYYHVDDTRQINSMNVDYLNSGDFENGFAVTGDGMTAYIWDGGNVLLNHQELIGRVVMLEADVPLSSHATGVAGVIGASGVTPLAKGMAPDVFIKALNFQGNAASEMAAESSDPENENYMISNHSYGTIVGWAEGNWGAGYGWYWFGDTSQSETESSMFGAYSDYDAYIDAILYNAPQHSMFKSSGNNNMTGPNGVVNHYVRNSSGQWVSSNTYRPKNCVANYGYDCLSFAGTTPKNLIAVGAILPLDGTRYEEPFDVIETSFSSFGPTDDGRIKPEITAIGQSVYAPTSTSSTSYTNWSGTSFSSPAAAGVGVLLQQIKMQSSNGNEYLRSDMMKAILTHSAFESGLYTGPDYKFGYGLVNALGAAEIILNSNQNAITENRKLLDGNTHTITVTAKGEEPIKVSIAWIDPAGEGVPQNAVPLNDRTPKLVNDLDLRVNDGTTTYSPWKLDPENPAAAATQEDNFVDNLEQVYIESPVAGQNYTITISHKGSLQTPITPAPEINFQEYALVITGVDAPMSVQNFDMSESISVYPNPVVDKLNINTNQKLNNVSIIVFNQMGQNLYTNQLTSMKNNDSIDFRTFPAGVYMVYIKSDEGTITKKIIKK